MLTEKPYIYIFYILSILIVIFNFINTVPILYFDEWNLILENLNYKFNFKDIFFYQHNEHKFGIWRLLYSPFIKLSSYDYQILTLIFSFFLILICFFCIKIYMNLSKGFSFHILSTTLVVFNLSQWNNFSWGMQSTFIFPLLIFTLFIYIVTRYTLNIKILILFLPLIILCTICTAMGFLVSFLISLYIATSIIKNKKWKLSLFSLLYFLISFSYFLVLNINKTFAPHKTYELYLYIKGFDQLFSAFLGLGSSYYVIFTCSVFIFFHSFFLYLKTNKKVYKVILFFMSLSFIYSMMLIYGRASLSLDFLNSSRYFVYIFPLYFGIILYFSTFKSLSINLFLCFSILFVHLYQNPIWYKNYITEQSKKRKWLECYSEDKSIDICQKIIIINPSNKVIIKTIKRSLKNNYPIPNLINNHKSLK